MEWERIPRAFWSPNKMLLKFRKIRKIRARPTSPPAEGGGSSRCPARVVGRSPPGDYFPYPVRGLDEHSLFKREAVWSSLEISASPGSEGHRGGVENGGFCMLFWDLPPQDASNAKFCDLPATRGRSLFPTTPVFPAEGAFDQHPLGGSKPPRPVPGSF